MMLWIFEKLVLLRLKTAVRILRSEAAPGGWRDAFRELRTRDAIGPPNTSKGMRHVVSIPPEEDEWEVSDRDLDELVNIADLEKALTGARDASAVDALEAFRRQEMSIYRKLPQFIVSREDPPFPKVKIKIEGRNIRRRSGVAGPHSISSTEMLQKLGSGVSPGLPLPPVRRANGPKSR